MITEKTLEELTRLTEAMIDDNGSEILNPKPQLVETDLEYEDIETRVRRIMRQELSLQAVNQGYESFDEANDFGPDDDEPKSQFEVMEDESPRMDAPPGSGTQPTDGANVTQPETEDTKNSPPSNEGVQPDAQKDGSEAG